MMDVMEFGKALLKTEDLDPVYSMLVNSGESWDWLARFCLCYWCFYDAGFAARCADLTSPSAYYKLMCEAVPKGRRGAERRHFRGAAAYNAIQALQKLGKPEKIVQSFFITLDYQQCDERIQRLPLFGPWISWKVCDMGERVLGFQVNFASASLAIYKDPRQGAALLLYGDWQHSISDKDLAQIVRCVVRNFNFKAPPRYDRRFNIQEAETVLCKYKAYTKGHYWVGKDIKDVTESLALVGADGLVSAMPENVPRGTN